MRKNKLMKKKFLMTATVPSMIGQFNMENIKLLLEMDYEVHVACNFEDRSVWTEERVSEFKKQLTNLGVKKIQIEYARTPYDILKLVRSYSELRKLIQREKYTCLHCHTPVAGMIARLAAKGTETKVIYTAHGFHFYKGAPLQNWLLYYPVEKWLSRYTDVLITINKEDYQRAKKKFHAKETKYIPGVGIDVEKIQAVQVDRVKKRAELGIGKDDFLMLSVGELSKRKNHQIVIEALAKLKDKRIKYIICGQGPLKDKLEQMAEKLGVKDQLFLLGFRTDVIEICKSSDLFVFPSRQEGLPVALMEAMASGLPCVVSRIRGNTDLIEDAGCLFETKHAESLKNVISVNTAALNNWRIKNNLNKAKIEIFSNKRIDRTMTNVYKKI